MLPLQLESEDANRMRYGCCARKDRQCPYRVVLINLMKPNSWIVGATSHLRHNHAQEPFVFVRPGLYFGSSKKKKSGVSWIDVVFVLVCLARLTFSEAHSPRPRSVASSPQKISQEVEDVFARFKRRIHADGRPQWSDRYRQRAFRARRQLCKSEFIRGSGRKRNSRPNSCVSGTGEGTARRC